MAKEITRKQLESLAVLQCTLVEMAAACGCSIDTIQRRVDEFYDMTYTQFIEYYGAVGHTSLRRAMWDNALRGNHKVQIFLAKNHLGMAEKIEEKHTGEVKIVKITDSIDTDQPPAEEKKKKSAPKKPKAKAKPKSKAKKKAKYA